MPICVKDVEHFKVCMDFFSETMKKQVRVGECMENVKMMQICIMQCKLGAELLYMTNGWELNCIAGLIQYGEAAEGVGSRKWSNKNGI